MKLEVTPRLRTEIPGGRQADALLIFGKRLQGERSETARGPGGTELFRPRAGRLRHKERLKVLHAITAGADRKVLT